MPELFASKAIIREAGQIPALDQEEVLLGKPEDTANTLKWNSGCRFKVLIE